MKNIKQYVSEYRFIFYIVLIDNIQKISQRRIAENFYLEVFSDFSIIPLASDTKGRFMLN